jgi:hypothetical protein
VEEGLECTRAEGFFMESENRVARHQSAKTTVGLPFSPPKLNDLIEQVAGSSPGPFELTCTFSLN